MENVEELRDFYEEKCDELEQERDAASLEKTRYFVIFKQGVCHVAVL